jgi:hypothetical protein
MSSPFVQGKYKLSWTHQVWPLAQQLFSLSERFTHQHYFGMLKVPESAVDNPCGTTRGTGCEVMLFKEKRATACLGTLSGNSDAVDASTSHNDFEVLACKRRATHDSCTHAQLDAKPAFRDRLQVILSKSWWLI